MGDASEDEIEDNRDRPRPKVDFTGVNAKEKCLILSSRGVTSRYRHLMLDIGTLIPHSKKDSKLDTKIPRDAVVEVADMKSCSSAMFFECRKRTDCYMWLAKVPEGPSVKFHVENVHTMAELKLTGNHLKFSRPALHFDATFDDASSPHLAHIKEMLTHVFTTPYKHHKMKPFLDHVFAFYWRTTACGSGTTRSRTRRAKRRAASGRRSSKPARGCVCTRSRSSPAPSGADAVRRPHVRLAQRREARGEEEGPGQVPAQGGEEGREEGARAHERAQAG